MSAQHTPSPWRVVRNYHDRIYIVGPRNDGKSTISDRICSVQQPRAGGGGNADFIVRACNAHEELLAALKALTDPPYPDGFCHKGICSEEKCTRCSRHARARAAIAKAEGQS
jgi:hypothetical protein